MMIAALVFLFLVGSFASALQAMKWLEKRQQTGDPKRLSDRRPGR